MFQRYMTVGYKGTGAETVNSVFFLFVCLFVFYSELTALLTMKLFDNESALTEQLANVEFQELVRGTSVKYSNEESQKRDGQKQTK